MLSAFIVLIIVPLYFENYKPQTVFWYIYNARQAYSRLKCGRTEYNWKDKILEHHFTVLAKLHYSHEDKKSKDSTMKAWMA